MWRCNVIHFITGDVVVVRYMTTTMKVAGTLLEIAGEGVPLGDCAEVGGKTLVEGESNIVHDADVDEDHAHWLVPTPPSLKGSMYNNGAGGEEMSPERHHCSGAGVILGGGHSRMMRSYSPTVLPGPSLNVPLVEQYKTVLQKAVSTKECSDSLQQVLKAWEDQVVLVHQELLMVTKKMHRERRRYSLKVMEKACEAKRLAVETESLRGIVEAKTASLEALQMRYRRENDALRERVSSLEKQLESNHQSFRDAGIDPSTAAEQLLEAYAENTRMEEQIEELQIDLEKATRYAESQDKYYQSKIEELQKEVKELQEGGQGKLQQQQNFGPMRRYIGSPVPSNGAPSQYSGSGVCSYNNNPLHGGGDFGEGGSVGSHGTRDEDILAAEVTNLRLKTKDLESQASQASDSARLASTLEKEASMLREENRKLRNMVSASMTEASEAKIEVAKLTSEANVLHAQLAEVISAINIGQENELMEQEVGVGAENHVPEPIKAMNPLTPSSPQDDVFDLEHATGTNDTEFSDIKTLFSKALLSVDHASRVLEEEGVTDDDVFA